MAGLYDVRHGTSLTRTDDELRADANPEERSWLAKALTSSGSSFAIAFLCTKALLPMRVPLTVAVTPVVARCADSLLTMAYMCRQHLLFILCVAQAPYFIENLHAFGSEVRWGMRYVSCRILQPRAVSEVARQAAREAAQQQSHKGV